MANSAQRRKARRAKKSAHKIASEEVKKALQQEHRHDPLRTTGAISWSVGSVGLCIAVQWLDAWWSVGLGLAIVVSGVLGGVGVGFWHAHWIQRHRRAYVVLGSLITLLGFFIPTLLTSEEKRRAARPVTIGDLENYVSRKPTTYELFKAGVDTERYWELPTRMPLQLGSDSGLHYELSMGKWDPEGKKVRLGLGGRFPGVSGPNALGFTLTLEEGCWYEGVLDWLEIRTIVEEVELPDRAVIWMGIVEKHNTAEELDAIMRQLSTRDALNMDVRRSCGEASLSERLSARR